MITNNYYINKVMRRVLRIIDFHPTTHHDSDINKKFTNVFYEFWNNVLTQGTSFVLLYFLFKKINLWVCITWAFAYATVHNINYLIKPPQTHKNHHKQVAYNLGIDIWDIIMGTKYPNEPAEKHNHYTINFIILTAIVCYLAPKFKKWSSPISS